MFHIIKNILILVALLATLVLGYFLYVRPIGIDDTNANLQFEITYKANKFVQRLNELKEIELSGDILADSRFTSLMTFAPAIVSEPLGRENPFEVNN